MSKVERLDAKLRILVDADAGNGTPVRRTSCPLAHTLRMLTDKAAGIPALFKDAKAFETWLRQHHAASTGLWLQIAKRGASETSVTYLEAVEIALCWGWIDGQKKGLDEQHFLQRFTPRRSRSVWSKVNADKVAVLIKEGRMQAPGLAQVESAQANGRERMTARGLQWCPKT